VLEDPVGVADGRGQDAQAPQHGRRIVASIIRIEHAGSGDRFCAAAALRHLQNEVAFGWYRYGNREAARRRNEQSGAIVGGRIVNTSIGVAILSHDGNWRMPPGRRFRELHVDAGDVAYIREHPNFGLARLALDDRLKLAVHRELHIPLIIRE